jgi:UDP-N-acetylglucosamine--N-acetylmuramyl-(pentapeptide) pyrophosphoryl-undecaprenol N-acetylglucosamine transferase
MKKKTVILAGGGTGGHIYPAVAIARAMLQKDPDLLIQFVGSPGGLETKIVPREGFPLHLIRVGKLNQSGGIFSKIKTLVGIPLALVQSAFLLRKLKPDVVLGVGGFASGPFVLMSSILGYKTAIWEPNAHPGLTNRWLSKFVRRSLVVFEEAEKFLKSKEVLQVGLPVRREVENVPEKPAGGAKFNIFIFGGSQGARTVNRVVKDCLTKHADKLKDVEVIHQTGPHDISDMTKSYEGYANYKPYEFLNGMENMTESYEGYANYKPYEFLHGMEKYYQWADLVICRAGASTVAELAACGRPAVLIPLPWAADDHQLKNAQSLVAHEAGVLLEQKDLNAESLLEIILSLKNDSTKRQKMMVNLKKFHKPRAADRIAEYLLETGEAL